MGAFYSFGITFNTEEDALLCKSEFSNHDFILSDNTKVESRIFVEKCDYKIDNLQQYICSIFPIGLELPGLNKKFVQAKFFYEIRSQLYQFLHRLNLEFNFAWFEFEAADLIKDDNPVFELERNGIGAIQNGALVEYFSGTYDENEYVPKRILDGFVLSESIYNASGLNISELKVFKKGYLWLPV